MHSLTKRNIRAVHVVYLAVVQKLNKEFLVDLTNFPSGFPSESLLSEMVDGSFASVASVCMWD